MRGRTLLSIVSVGSLVLMGVAAGCGDTTEAKPTTSTTDSGLDGPKTTDATATDSPANECVDADITNLAIPDASLGDGGANTAECSACLKKNCSGELDVCQADCQCREGVLSFFNCVGTGKPLTTCGASLAGAGSTAQGLALCAFSSGCDTKCGVPKDAGTAKKDAASDAANDG